MEIKRPDGTTRWIATRGDAVRNERGEIVAVAGTAQDITELKDLQRQRDEWTSVMAHDLRQPIGVITMAASALPEVHAAAPDKESEMVARIASAAKGLARLVTISSTCRCSSAAPQSRSSLAQAADARAGDTERLMHLMDGHHIVVAEGQGLARCASIRCAWARCSAT
jgi:signal transduction histidine kinase